MEGVSQSVSVIGFNMGSNGVCEIIQKTKKKQSEFCCSAQTSFAVIGGVL